MVDVAASCRSFAEKHWARGRPKALREIIVMKAARASLSRQNR
jgi:hypothetical protein